MRYLGMSIPATALVVALVSGQLNFPNGPGHTYSTDVGATRTVVLPNATTATDGLFSTESMPVSRFVAELSRESKKRIVIEGPGLDDVRVGGVFNFHDVRGTLDKVQRICSCFSIKEHNGMYILKSRPPSKRGQGWSRGVPTTI